MTPEETTQTLNLYLENYYPIRDWVWDNVKTISMREIDEKVAKVYDFTTGPMAGHMFDPVLGEAKMLSSLYSDYIIGCANYNVVPRSGYSDQDEERRDSNV